MVSKKFMLFAIVLAGCGRMKPVTGVNAIETNHNSPADPSYSAAYMANSGQRPSTSTPGYDPTANNTGYYSAQLAEHNSDFLETLVYADASGACFFYKDFGSPVITSIPCPAYIVPVVQGNPFNLSPYDSSLYGATATCNHVHMPGANGGAADKQLSPIICGTAFGLPSQYGLPPNLNGQPLGTTYASLKKNSPSTSTPGYDPTANNTGYYSAQLAEHNSDFLETLLYADASGACFFYKDFGSPVITSIPCPAYIVPVVQGNPFNLSPYDSSLYGATATCNHVHMPGANGGAADKQLSPIICGTAFGLPSQYGLPPNLNGQPLGTTYASLKKNSPSTSTPGYDPTANNTGYYSGQLAEHNSDFLETLVYADASGACFFYKDFGSPVITSIPCPAYIVPVVQGNPFNLSPYDSSLYGATATCNHVHMPSANGGAADKQLSPIICGTAFGLPSQYGNPPNQNGQPLKTIQSGAPIGCHKNSDCGQNQMCFGATPNQGGTCN